MLIRGEKLTIVPQILCEWNKIEINLYVHDNSVEQKATRVGNEPRFSPSLRRSRVRIWADVDQNLHRNQTEVHKTQLMKKDP